MRKVLVQLKLRYIYLVFLIPIFLLFAFSTSLTMATIASGQENSYLPCKCVIFRLDDVGDYGANQVQSSIMDHFISENKKLIVAIILNDFGNLGPDGVVYAKVKEGYDKGLFELGIHGWNHIKYSDLTEGQQLDSFIEANRKLQSLFGNKSRIFVPPFNEFNSGTVQAMGKAGLNIFSTSYQKEDRTPNPYKVSNRFITNNSKIQMSEANIYDSSSSHTIKEPVYHVPFDTSYLELIRQGYSGENLTQKILTNVNKNIARYGFSVITLHPTDFAAIDSSTGKYTNSVDAIKFQYLVDIIDMLQSQRISITDFSHITKVPFYQMNSNSSSR